MREVKDFPLADRMWYRVGGKAELACFPESIEDVQHLVSRFGLEKLTVLGKGSNALISDTGVSGVTVLTEGLDKVTEEQESEGFQLVAEAGVSKAHLTKLFLKRKLSPALFLSGIPGDLGGGLFMNAGVSEKIRPREFCEIVDWVEVVNDKAEIVRFSSDQINWSYRKSQGWQPGILVRAQLSWNEAPDPELPQKVRAATKSRLSRQPLEFPSCGSVFVNPEGDSSGRLIEACGLKGHTIGGAEISSKHANFIINTGEATASDIKSLIELAQQTVFEKFGVSLKTEVRFIGDF